MKALETLKDTLKQLLLLTNLLLLVSFGYYTYVHTQRIPKVDKTPKLTNTPSTNVIRTKTTNLGDTEVKVETIYTAGDKKVSTGVQRIPPGTTTTPTIKQEIDLTHLLPKKNWEVGVGLGVHRGNPYIPLSIQRNYKTDKAVQVEVQFDMRTRKVQGVEVQHKWSF